jgi:hypothetical protein
MVEFMGFSARRGAANPESIPEVMRSFLSWNTRKAVGGERRMAGIDIEPASKLRTLPAQFFHQVLPPKMIPQLVRGRLERAAIQR